MVYHLCFSNNIFIRWSGSCQIQGIYAISVSVTVVTLSSVNTSTWYIVTSTERNVTEIPVCQATPIFCLRKFCLTVKTKHFQLSKNCHFNMADPFNWHKIVTKTYKIFWSTWNFSYVAFLRSSRRYKFLSKTGASCGIQNVK